MPANVAHKNLADSSLHEPKGIASAPSSTVYVANGVGSGTWQMPITPSSEYHASMEIFNNSSATSLNAAVDSSLHTPTDYVSISQLYQEDPDKLKGLSVDGNKKIIINRSGTYQLNIWASVSTSTASALLALSPEVDSINMSDTIPVTKVLSKDIGNINSVSGTGYLRLAAGQTLSFGIACDKTTQATVHESIFNILLVQEI